MMCPNAARSLSSWYCMFVGNIDRASGATTNNVA